MGQTRLVKLRYTLPALANLNAVLDYISARPFQSAAWSQNGRALVASQHRRFQRSFLRTDA